MALIDLSVNVMGISPTKRPVFATVSALFRDKHTRAERHHCRLSMRPTNPKEPLPNKLLPFLGSWFSGEQVPRGGQTMPSTGPSVILARIIPTLIVRSAFLAGLLEVSLPAVAAVGGDASSVRNDCEQVKGTLQIRREVAYSGSARAWLDGTESRMSSPTEMNPMAVPRSWEARGQVPTRAEAGVGHQNARRGRTK
jgi:hypothetical protein